MNRERACVDAVRSPSARCRSIVADTDRNCTSNWRHGRESNPRMAVLQTAALPLRHRASITTKKKPGKTDASRALDWTDALSARRYTRTSTRHTSRRSHRDRTATTTASRMTQRWRLAVGSSADSCWFCVARLGQQRSMVELNSARSCVVELAARGGGEAGVNPLHRPSRPTKIVAGQVFRLTACGTFSHISAGAPAIR